MVCHQNEHIDQWNKTEELNINLHTYGHLLLNKESKTTHSEKNASSANSASQSACRRTEIDP